MKFLSQLDGAEKVKIVDAAGNFTSNDVEGALAELVSFISANTYSHPTGFNNQPITALTGASVLSQITINTEGHVTGVTSRNLTASDVGAASTIHTHVLADITNAGTVAAIDTNGSTFNYLRGDGKWVTPPNATYAAISEAEITAGTASTLRVITAQRLKFVQDNTERYHVGTTAPSNNKLLWIDTN